MQELSYQPHPDDSARSGWLDRLGSLFYFRTHISMFMLGSVVLLAIDLLLANGNILADKAIGLWAILIVVHLLLVIIARLLAELMKPEPTPVIVVRETSLAPTASPSADAAPVAPAITPTVPAAPPVTTTPAPSTDADGEAPSWTVATHDAWLTKEYRANDTAPGDPAPTDSTQ